MTSRDLLNSSISQKNLMKENITPHKIAVVLFIKEFCLIKAKARPGQLLTCEDGSFYSVEPVHRRDFCMLVLKLIQSPDMELSEFMTVLHSGQYSWLPAHLSALKKTLAEINDGGVCAIQTLIHDLNTTIFSDSALLQPVVNKSSIIGLFLRRIIIFFDKLTFSQVVAIYRSYKAYYYRAKLAGADLRCAAENYAAGSSTVADSIRSEDMDISSAIGLDSECKLPSPSSRGGMKMDLLALEGEVVSWSRRQAELFIAQQVNLLQNNESLALSPPKLQEKIRDILQANPDYAEAHYLSYLNCLRVREYCGAVDSLFHCFDRNTAIAANSTTIDDKNRSFRYATLNLAILHAQFGQRGEALCALREAVQMAHEANDDICLQHAQTWLYRLSNNNKEVLIQRSVQRSSDLKLSYLTSLGIQSLAQCTAITGTKPAIVFEILMKSDTLNQNSVLELLANSFAQKAALWLLYGKMEMSLLASQLLLCLYTLDAMPNSGYSGESTCLALCCVANAFVQEGKYQLASVLLQHARLQFPHEPMSHAWMYIEQLLYFFEALHNGRWQEAEQAVGRMSSVHKWDSLLRKAELLLSKGDAVGAMSAVHSVLDAPANECDMGSGVGLHSTHNTGGARLALRVRALVLSAEAQSVNGPAPATAVCVLTTALGLAQQNYLELHAALVACHLANLQLQLGLPAQALSLLDEWLLVVLAHGGAYDRGRALLLLAKCRVAAATSLPCSLEDRIRVVTEAINTLERAKTLFTQVEAISRVKDVLYLQALLYNEVDCVLGRKKCALEFRALDEQHPTKIATTLLNRF
ncbi:anaphase-promoting complex subunit 5 [Frankliniella occidentalis]|uniref:Anaphase-promoting complex subunit 5 n=1 Tax=Frankliniella occidentalis TaxID=133901 RepID=A0A6J1RWF2_FRAOC|nr:anaphase-promoting complex subunit 5 [Frankliniella occidentalis]